MRDFKGATALVVGGAGFVGSNLVKRLCAEKAGRIVVIDNLLSAERSSVPDDSTVEFVEASIADDEVLVRLSDDFDFAFHLATYHGNQSSIHDPLADHENNTLTSLKLFLRLSEFRRLEKLVYASAGCTVAEKTFDRAEATTEDSPVSLYLDSPYQISKIVGEFYGNYFFRRCGLPVVKARFQNVYGPGETLGAGRWRGTPATVWRNVVPTFVYLALKGRPLTVENGGVATRDFIFVDDVVEGLMRCASAGRPGEVYNLASGEETSILELANLVNRLAGNSTPLDFRPKRDWDRSGKRFGSTDKARAELQFQARMRFEEGLRRTIAWARDNLNTIDECIARHAEMMKVRRAG